MCVFACARECPVSPLPCESEQFSNTFDSTCIISTSGQTCVPKSSVRPCLTSFLVVVSGYFQYDVSVKITKSQHTWITNCVNQPIFRVRAADFLHLSPGMWSNRGCFRHLQFAQELETYWGWMWVCSRRMFSRVLAYRYTPTEEGQVRENTRFRWPASGRSPPAERLPAPAVHTLIIHCPMRPEVPQISSNVLWSLEPLQALTGATIVSESLHPWSKSAIKRTFMVAFCLWVVASLLFFYGSIKSAHKGK